jgi:putative hemolysin
VLAGLGLPEGLAATLALVVVMVTISYLSLVLDELVPKRLALQRTERISLVVAPMLDRIASTRRSVAFLQFCAYERPRAAAAACPRAVRWWSGRA